MTNMHGPYDLRKKLRIEVFVGCLRRTFVSYEDPHLISEVGDP